jgi:apolipoprotein D and lipocalin family protein
MKIHLLLLVFMFIANPVLPSHGNSRQPAPVNSVDLSKYVGLWYEIAKIPNRFQDQCAGNTTAAYELREDGRIAVINRCVKKDGSTNEARGIAKVIDTQSNARLKVSFVEILGLSLFWGDYWIIGLDENYRYAIVGSPSRKYGWILSRAPKMSEETLDEVFAILRGQGYDPLKFELTAHDQ